MYFYSLFCSGINSVKIAAAVEASTALEPENFGEKTATFTNVEEAWAYSFKQQVRDGYEGLIPAEAIHHFTAAEWDAKTDADKYTWVEYELPDGSYLAVSKNGHLRCSRSVYPIIQWEQKSWDADVYSSSGYVGPNGLITAEIPKDVVIACRFETIEGETW